ncbi:cupin domain-containing protein [Sphingomonas sp. UYP23]
MEITRLNAAPLYTLPDHEDVVARRLQGGEASTLDFAMVGHSTVRAGGIVPMGAGPIGKVYVLTGGALVVVQADGVRHQLHRGDSVYILPGEARAIANETNAPATMIVITPAPPQ